MTNVIGLALMSIAMTTMPVYVVSNAEIYPQYQLNDVFGQKHYTIIGNLKSDSIVGSALTVLSITTTPVYVTNVMETISCTEAGCTNTYEGEIVIIDREARLCADHSLLRSLGKEIHNQGCPNCVSEKSHKEKTRFADHIHPQTNGIHVADREVITVGANGKPLYRVVCQTLTTNKARSWIRYNEGVFLELVKPGDKR